jgi:hypothetical protein
VHLAEGGTLLTVAVEQLVWNTSSSSACTHVVCASGKDSLLTFNVSIETGMPLTNGAPMGLALTKASKLCLIFAAMSRCSSKLAS